MRTIINLYKASYAPISDLETYSPLPSHAIPHIDPFIFLNHHGPQSYPPKNNVLPFGPHPHRGMETVTIIVSGDIVHKDSISGKESIINEGGVQWMTAGRGLIHLEQCSDHFKEHGGEFEVLQLWLNLPAKMKMIPPEYRGLQNEDIPILDFYDGKVKVQLVSGSLGGQKGAFKSLTDVYLSIIRLKEGGKVELQAPMDHNILFYVVSGNLRANNTPVEALHLVQFDHDAGNIQVEASTDGILLFAHARPYNEPIVARGPFVMNSEAEVQQAYRDYQDGKFE